MGVTIHYRGTLKDKNLVRELVEEMIDISKSMNWEWQVLDEDWSRPSNPTLEFTETGAEIVGHLALKGINLNVHPESESLDLFFDANGELTTPMNIILAQEGKIAADDPWCFVKTQFAPVDAHITIVRLLKYLQKRYIPNLEVVDEGDYWETEDKEKLAGKINSINGKIDALGNAISEMEIDPDRGYTAEKLAELLEERLKKGI